MRRKTFILTAGAMGIFLLCGSISADGVTVADLQKRLSQGEKLTVIDVRSTPQFQQDHIPGAINVPAQLCPQKHLPPLGKVVVYDAGLGLTQPDSAAAALAAKPGITVEILEGGFAAWEASQAVTTRGAGMKSEKYNYISYADLKGAKPDEILLVDLRETPAAASKTSPSTVQTNQPLTDLSLEFPNLRQKKATSGLRSLAQTTKQDGAPPLLVLIDNGDGKAQKMAQELKAQGVKRYTILAGGELILARHGQAGLERNSPGHPQLRQITNPAQTNK